MNSDTLLSGLQLDAAQNANSQEAGNFLTDALSNPIGAVEAVAFDMYAAANNLVAPVTGAPVIHEKAALNMMTGMGFGDAAEYYKSHPDAVQMTSMLAGGWKIGTMGGNYLSRRIGKGLSKVTDTGEVISRAMQAEHRLQEVAKVALPESDMFKAAMRKYRFETTLSDVGTNVAQAAVADLAMSQSIGAEDLTPTDYALGLGLVGAGTYALKSIANQFQGLQGVTNEIAIANNKAIMEGLATVPPELKGNMGEALVLSNRVKQIENTLNNSPDLLPVTRDNLTALQREHQARIITQLQDITHSELRATVGVQDYKAELSVQLAKRIEDNPASLAGVHKVEPYKHGSYTNIDTSKGELITGMLRAAQKNINPSEVDLSIISRDTGYSIKQLAHIQKVMNSAIYDMRSATLMPISASSKVAGVGDIGIGDLEYVAELLPHQGTAAQIQYNHLMAATRGRTIANKGLAFNQQSLEGLTLENSIQALEYLGSGKQFNPKMATKGFDINKALYAAHRKLVHTQVQDLSAMGMNSLEISIRTHTNWRGVEELIAKRFPTDGTKLEEELYRGFGKESWDAIGKTKNLVVLQGNASQAGTRLEIAASLDDKVNRGMSEELVAILANSSNSVLAGKLYDVNTSGGSRAVRAGLETVNPAFFSSNTRFLTSADHVHRNQKGIANFLHFGSEIKALVGDTTKALVAPINKELQTISTSTIERVAWNKSLSAIRSAKPVGDMEIRVGVGANSNTLGLVKIGDDLQNPTTFMPLLKADGAELGDLPKSVIQFWEGYSKGLGQEIRGMQNFVRGLHGQGEIKAQGLHVPALNLTKEHLAYMPAEDGLTTTLLHSPTKKGLEELVIQARKQNPEANIVTKSGELKDFNIIENHIELGQMRIAEFGKAKTGAVYNEVDAGTSQMAEFIDGNHSMLRRLSTTSMKAMNPESMDFLRAMNKIADTGDKENLYQSLEQTIFGSSELALHNSWQRSNTWVGERLGNAIANFNGMFNIKGANSLLTAQKTIADFQASGMSDQLPWKGLNEAVAQTEAFRRKGKLGEESIAALNFFTAGFALRFLEGAHSIVTMLSVPITTMPEVMLSMEGKGSGMFSAMKFMTEGVRRGYSKEFAGDILRWKAKGIVNNLVSESTAEIQNLMVTGGIVGKISDSKVFQNLSKPSDWAESNARQIAASTASAIYDELHGAGSFRSHAGDAFVDLFTKRAMGNYNATQRPIMFQGPLGSAIGLFQTYIWTMGQNIYRGLEQGNKGAVGAMMSMQAGVFGLRSLPGYDILNHHIGNHLGNTDNRDITSAVYNNTDTNFEAEVALYGAPSALFESALWTRGVLGFRFPLSPDVKDSNSAGLNLDFAGLSIVAKGMGMVKDTYNRVQEGAGGMDSLRAAFQLQTISRPIARLADMWAGVGIDRSGAVVDPDAGFKLNLSTAIRAMGARAMNDQVIRDTLYQGSFYSRSGGNYKREIYKAVRSNVRNGKSNAEQLVNYEARGGTRESWTAMLNTIAIENEQGKIHTVPDTTLSDSIGIL